MNAIILIQGAKPFAMSNSTGYILGAIIALFLLAYLLYTLIRPEKF